MDLPLIIGMAILATVVGGYIAASVILLKFPQLIHKRKKLKFRPVHISHRGGAGENCENTISAFKQSAFPQLLAGIENLILQPPVALRHGTQMLEIDCHLTKDGEVVVSHDQHLLNKCGTDVKIADIDLKDLPEYKPVLSVDFRPSFSVECGDDRRIPTLREVLLSFPETPLNIDVKVYDETLFHKVNGLIKEFHREELTIWGGRLSETTKALNKLNPDIPVFFSFRRVFTLLLLFYSGLLPFIPLYESTLEIIMPSIAFNMNNRKAELSWKFRTILRLADVLLMRPALFRHLDRRGIQTYLWVLNEEQDWDRAFKLGATGVMTDFPAKLSEYLRQHPELCVDTLTSIENAKLLPAKQPEA